MGETGSCKSPGKRNSGTITWCSEDVDEGRIHRYGEWFCLVFFGNNVDQAGQKSIEEGSPAGAGTKI